MKQIKILNKSSRYVSNINFENRLISYISEHHFLNHWWGKCFDFKKQYLLAVPLTSACLPINHKYLSYPSLMFC